MGSIYRKLFDSMNRFQLNDHRFSQVPVIVEGSSDANPCDDETPVACDYSHGVYEYIKQMLMEEDDLAYKPCMFQDCSALQAAEKYFYDALSDKDSTNLDADSTLPAFGVDQKTVANDENPDLGRFTSGFGHSFLVDSQVDGEGLSINGPLHDFVGLLSASASRFHVLQTGEGRDIMKNFPKDDSQMKKNHDRGDNGDIEEGRSSKQSASYAQESEPTTEKYDKAFLCHKMNPGFYNESPVCHCSESGDEGEIKYRKSPEVKRGRPKGSKKQRNVKEAVDLRTLLTRCAQAVSSFNTTTAQELLMKIRQYSSPYGNATDRLSHCFANALEARMAGTGSLLYTASTSRRIPAAELIKAYQTYVTACPFARMSTIFANKTIARHTREADKIHIIDFGILYGYQWPCIIQGISLRPGGPPLLKITGIDFPQPGFKPAERVEQTGRRLMNYCKRFNVPFEYNAIAKKWDDIRVDDLKIERDEMLVVNCLYRLRHLPDESAGGNSPRDAALELIKKIKPYLFVHGVVNGTYNASFYTTRFREVLYHYSSLFDMLEATIPREDHDRLMYEREVFGRDVMNVVACEGSERVERPETYKQWQVRNQRAGFSQVPLNQEILKEVKTKVRKGYHNDFLLDEDRDWMLQGWKGRVMYALSCWKPSLE